ncbi:hypothetical protein [Burkholderia glumae]|uniref:hypothetical protein n=1 Tax=Burkholderia glumae TaxID=337 RepID=UPI00148EAADC|nr:hypothetical protein [Burkholderia glumae]QJW80025.1 hypothetical protein GAS18_15525 [Burkholderia glumae]
MPNMNEKRKMRIHKIFGALAGALALSALLSACSGAPGESDVRDALDKQIDQARDQVEKLGGTAAASVMASDFDSQKADIAQAKLIDCRADGDKAWLCDLAAKTGSVRLRMLKGPDGWIAAKAG